LIIVDEILQSRQIRQISLHGDPRILYTVMLEIRMWILVAGWKWTAFALMISTRYSAVRRQFSEHS